jgi:hypothetical protein
MSATQWRRVGPRDTPYPSWLRELADKSGVYAIRLVGLFSREVVEAPWARESKAYVARKVDEGTDIFSKRVILREVGPGSDCN